MENGIIWKMILLETIANIYFSYNVSMQRILIWRFLEELHLAHNVADISSYFMTTHVFFFSEITLTLYLPFN